MAVRHSMVGVSEAAVQALGDAAKQVIGRLSGVVQAATEAEGQLNGAVAASRRCCWPAVGVVAA